MKSVLKKSVFLLFFSLFFLLIKMPSEAAQLKPTGDVRTFTDQMKLTTVMIDVGIMTGTPPEPKIINSHFEAYTGGKFKNAVVYKSVTKADIGKSLPNIGDCFQYRYINAATLPDGTKADILITYSDVNLYVSSYAGGADSIEGSADPGGKVIVAHGNELDSYAIETENTQNSSWYVGVEQTLRAQVVYPGTTTPVANQDMLFWMNGITVLRGIAKTDKDGKITWAATTNNYRRIPFSYPDKYGFNEQIELTKSLLVDDIYYPAIDYKTAIADFPSGNVLFYANGGVNGDYDTGFATAADAGSGAIVTYRAGTGWNIKNGGSQGIDNALWPTKFTHSILSSSGNGGSIWTNKNGDGTGMKYPGGTWTGSKAPDRNYLYGNEITPELGQPLMYVVPDRKSTVVYTMRPDDGYIIDKLYVNGKEAAWEAHQDETGVYYTFTFHNSTENQSIHVTWKQAVLEVKKIWAPENASSHPDTIQVQLLRNGEPVPGYVKSLSKDNNWTETFTGLPIGPEYSVKEDFKGIENYESKTELISRSEDGTSFSFTITNERKFLSAAFPLIWKVIEAPDEGALNAEYTFTISGDPLPKDENGSDVSSVTISSSDSIPRKKTVGTVSLPAGNGTYTYTVKEEPDPDGKYTVTPQVYTVIYTVSGGVISGPVIESDGKPYSGRDLVFENEYEWPSGTTEAQVRKRIDGLQPAGHEETYTFRITRLTEGAPMPDDESDRLGFREVTLTGEGVKGFGPVSFTCKSDQDCEYKYSVREIIPLTKVPGEIYDTTEYLCTVVVDHITGQVKNKIVVVDNKEIEHKDNTYVFVNTFPKEMPVVEPKVRKLVLHGDPDPADKFFFELELTKKPEGVEKDPMPVLSDGTKKEINMNGKAILSGYPASFGKIQFEAYGEYVYTIRELQKEDMPEDQYFDKYTYDDNVFTVRYNVHPTDDGKIVAEAQWTNKSGEVLREDGLIDGAVTFLNPLKLSGAADDLHVRKQITPTGIEIEQTTPFTFTLELLNAPKDLTVKPMPEEQDKPRLKCVYDDPEKSVLKCTLVSGSRNFYFGEMDFPVDGTYSYAVKEVDESQLYPDFEYSTEAYYVTYEVENGAIKSKKVMTKDEKPYEGSELIFTNTYHQPLHTEVEAVVKKVILDGDPKDGDTFHFTLERRDEKYPMPEKSSGKTKIIEIKASKDEPMELGFGEIIFENPGVYVYDVKEVQGELDHYVYDTTVYTVIWTVTSEKKDEANRQLAAKMTVEMDGYRGDERSGDVLLFENEYADPDEGTLMINKFVIGGIPEVRDYFTFHAKGLETTAEGLEVSPLPEKCKDNLCTLSILGTGHGYFGKVKYEKDGEYNYEVWEAAGKSEDYEYDGSVYTVKMIVKDGVLLRDQIQIKRDGVPIPNHDAVISFENHYLKGIDESHPKVHKIIKGDPNRDDPFVFRLKVTPGHEDYPMPAGARNGIIEITINGEGEDSFGTIAFEKPGKYIYTIEEDRSQPISGYKYDDTIYTVIFDVTKESDREDTHVVKTVMKGGVEYTGKFYEFTNIWGDGEEDEGGGDGGGSCSDVLPRTGFAPGVVTKLPPQRVSYSAYNQLRLRIPSLGIDSEILGIPKTEGDWDVSWLGDNVGWLQNTAWPGSVKAGNTVLTGHSYNDLGYPGVFANLERLTYGCSISITAFGETFVYLVDSVQTVFADTPQVLSQKTDVPELTLITCKYYNAASDQYDGRVVVKAKLAEIR